MTLPAQSAMFRHTRAILAVVVVTACLMSVAGLFIVGRGGAISEANHRNALRELISIYSPLTALVLAFYFSDIQGTSKREHAGRFVVALTVVGAWCLAPAFLFGTIHVVERVIAYLEILRGWGETVALAVLGFYFGKQKAA